MKNLFVLFSFMILSLGLNAQIDFENISLERALSKADSEEKLVMVDAYTTWCPPCKDMAKNTFSDYEVGELYNDYFVSIKVNMEKFAGNKLHNRYGITAFPTILFLDTNGREVYRVVGKQNVNEFLTVGRTIANYYFY